VSLVTYWPCFAPRNVQDASSVVCGIDPHWCLPSIYLLAGQLGDGTQTTALTPVAVVGLSDVRSISAGDSHTCAALMNGTAYCWGKNNFGTHVVSE